MNRNRVFRWLLFVILMISFSAGAYAQVLISVRIGPPALPIYAQPYCPGPGYAWTPGYWAWNDDEGYFWVPGTWVMAPVGMYWTPGYWGWNDGFYAFHRGYWGPHVGFYGGINYGYGYTGAGFYGGYWNHDRFYYNRSVTNVNVTNVTNVYNKTVIVNNTTINRVSYNGGRGGVVARPSPREEAWGREQHRDPLPVQEQHREAASRNRELFARENHGRPAIAATARPAEFSGRDVVRARAAGAPYHAPTISPREARGPANEGNRPMSPVNSNHSNTRENRPATPSNSAARPKSNDGFRPFTPPNAEKRNSNENARPNNPQNSRGSNPAREDRPFTPPAKNNENQRQSSPTYHDNNNTGNNPMHEPRDNARENAPPPTQHESRPPESRQAPLQHEAAPREAAPRESVPRHESAPPARPQHQESAPRRDAPPKQDKEHRDDHRPNRGR